MKDNYLKYFSFDPDRVLVISSGNWHNIGRFYIQKSKPKPVIKQRQSDCCVCAGEENRETDEGGERSGRCSQAFNKGWRLIHLHCKRRVAILSSWQFPVNWTLYLFQLLCRHPSCLASCCKLLLSTCLPSKTFFFLKKNIQVY